MLAILLSPIYLFFHGYLCYRLLTWLSAISPVFSGKNVRFVFWVLYFLAASSIGFGAALPDSALQRICTVFGNYWLGVTLYEALIIVPVDLLFLFAKWLQKKRGKENLDKEGGRKIFITAGLVCVLAVSGISTWGVAQGNQLHTAKYQIVVEKEGGEDNSLRAVLIADLHMGYSVGTRQIGKMVEQINAQNPDIILIAGDIFDNDYDAMREPEKLISLFRQLSPKYGIYACYGNHDIDEKIIAGFTFGWGPKAQQKKKSDPRMDKFLERAGVQLLQDEGVLIDNRFYVYGRPDAVKSPDRKTPQEIAAELDLSKPVLLIDHQPKELEALAAAGIDVDFCGHTHDGQMFPMNLVQCFIWENPVGHIKKGEMHNIVTSGVGLFGPNMRVGTKAEICVVDIDFRSIVDRHSK